MRKLISKIISIVFPAKCIFCGKFINETPLHMCRECINKIKFNKKYCHFCGEPLDTVFGSPLCVDCKGLEKPYERVFTPLVYEGATRTSIINFKYKNKISYAKTFAILIFTEIKKSGYIPDAITFVPIHFFRKFNRGYNQTEILSKELSALFSVPCVKLLKKNYYTKKLAGLSASQRRKTVKGSFSAIKQKENYDNILLIDDVITTSSTITECCRILKKEYGCNINVAAIASTSKYKL